ncbi:MAG: HAMP domain-containing histidine kinase [Bacteroidia bacterium]|nr:HAMP domain-containing histidine kinase [Bacteroidia bacterium]MDW8089074.1 HAMP domain-containing sensor histidine kinase [Bacteroidia bacterium]
MRLRWIFLMVSAVLLVLVGISFYAHILAQRLLEQQIALVRFYARALEYTSRAPQECLREFFWEYIFPDRQAGAQLFLIPMVLTDGRGVVLSHNLRELRLAFPEERRIEGFLRVLRADTVRFPPIQVPYAPGRSLKIYYGEPILLRHIRWMPALSSALIVLMAVVGISFLYTAYRYRQDKLWMGLARETAHQLGTPLSGLVGAIELIKETPFHLPRLLPHIEADLRRLEEVADRFAKIGIAPRLQIQPIIPIIQEVVAYYRLRVPPRVKIDFIYPEGLSPALPLNATLLKWVIENLLRNSLDALSPAEEGQITLRLQVRKTEVWLDVEDTGKGISPADWEEIFRPGFSTKPRGWGIGLALARRVIESYHGGEIFVHQSEVGKGTTIRIRLPLRQRLPLGQRILHALRYQGRRLFFLVRSKLGRRQRRSHPAVNPARAQ